MLIACFPASNTTLWGSGNIRKWGLITESRPQPEGYLQRLCLGPGSSLYSASCPLWGEELPPVLWWPWNSPSPPTQSQQHWRQWTKASGWGKTGHITETRGVTKRMRCPQIEATRGSRLWDHHTQFCDLLVVTPDPRRRHEQWFFLCYVFKLHFNFKNFYVHVSVRGCQGASECGWRSENNLGAAVSP